MVTPEPSIDSGWSTEWPEGVVVTTQADSDLPLLAAALGPALHSILVLQAHKMQELCRHGCFHGHFIEYSGMPGILCHSMWNTSMEPPMDWLVIKVWESMCRDPTNIETRTLSDICWEKQQFARQACESWKHQHVSSEHNHLYREQQSMEENAPSPRFQRIFWTNLIAKLLVGASLPNI